MHNSGHVRSAQRATPTTPRSTRGSQIHTPRGISEHVPPTVSTASEPSTSGNGFLAYAFASQPGYPSQPMSSRWPLSDDRFDSSLVSARRTAATPRPNFYTLDEDATAWQGGCLTTLRGGKGFSFPPPSEVAATTTKAACSSGAAYSSAALGSAAWWYETLSDRPLAHTTDRQLPPPKLRSP
eukprot:CAMPEP_0174758250 /NCGR_PEP_ID=MMETSP1094-20130205/107672_1 /TAXON_ID=156173 /ORGANISM="Chrysochromulina brevifilum, Strain UTEX LB 985" /LENGTH=181 /DNA_ID=CAMNT_0015964177 /DNA_START=27 /DNA_END=572 /DNA_ORIENTATION=-